MRGTVRLALCVATLAATQVVDVVAQLRQQRVDSAAAMLRTLVETYGVSGDEEPVRAAVENLLPDWANPSVDSAGNLWVRVGSGDPVVVFVAHLDEVGWEVTDIRSDGKLAIRQRGGFMPWLWEASPALVHTRAGQIPGVFTPRDGPVENRQASDGFVVDVGTSTAPQTVQLDIAIGDKITNPKKFVRLAGNRATGRSFDDRVGSTAQIMALHSLDPDELDHEVIFLWVVEEEIGLIGARVAAGALGFQPVRVYAIDTFVSADSPHDAQNFAVTPLGQGPVARGVDNSSVTPPAVLDTLVRLARRRGLPLQVGTTNGGNDGSAFQAYGVVDVPIGWPLRYSHSPVEVIDLADLVVLADLIKAIAEEW